MLNLQEVEERYFDGQPAVDCCGLIKLHFEKNPDAGSMFNFDPDFMQSFVEDLLEHEYVKEKFPTELRLIFNDPAYEEVLSKLELNNCEFLTTKDKTYLVLIIKR